MKKLIFILFALLISTGNQAKTYGAAARKGWLALITYINKNDELTEACEGTNIKNDRNHYCSGRGLSATWTDRLRCSGVPWLY